MSVCMCVYECVYVRVFMLTFIYSQFISCLLHCCYHIVCTIASINNDAYMSVIHLRQAKYGVIVFYFKTTTYNEGIKSI